MVSSIKGGKGFRRVVIGLTLFVWPLALVVLFGLFSSLSDLVSSHRPQLSTAEVLSVWDSTLKNVPRVIKSPILDQLAAERETLVRFGTVLEESIFTAVAQNLLSRTNNEFLTGFDLLSSVRIKLFLGLINLAFVILALSRALLLLTVAAGLYGYFKSQLFRSHGLFGALSDGRFFSSALNANRIRMHHSGSSEIHIPSSMPIKLSTEKEALGSGLGKLLTSRGVANPTNIFLTRVICGAATQPAYCAQLAELSVLDHYFEGNTLIDDVTAVLKKVIHLHSEYCTGSVGNDDLLLDKIHESIKAKNQDYRTTGDFILELECLLHRVLQPPMRDELAAVPIIQVVSAVLAAKVGGITRRRFDGAKWYEIGDIGLSNKRAINLAPSFGEDYDPIARRALHLALAYSNPDADVAQIKLPLEMSDGARALRQWVALLSCPPHQIVSKSEIVELFGLSSEIARRWSESFIDSLASLDPFVVRSSVVGADDSVLVPIDVIIQLSKGRIPTSALERARELCYALYARRLDENLLKDGLPRSWIGGITPGNEFFKPLATTHFADLLEQHGVAREEIQYWEALRYVLGGFGWLRTFFLGAPIIDRAALMVECSTKKDSARLVGMWPIDSAILKGRFGDAWKERFDAYSAPSLVEFRRAKDRSRKGAKPFLRAVSGERRRARGGAR